MKTEFLNDTLEQLKDKGLRRQMPVVNGAQGPRIMIGGREVINFCSNNYLGLADDPRLKEAAIESIRTEGVGTGASRLVCGNSGAHEDLQNRLAELKGAERCLVFSTGYMANVGIIAALCDRDSVVFSDRLNHASIVDGIILSRAQMVRYPHKDMTALESQLSSYKNTSRKLIITDTVFSMDGDMAPLDHIVELAERYQAMVMVDEAHGFGVLGPNGHGAVEHFGLQDRIAVQMGTLSKAAGVFGAYCCGSAQLIEYLINTCRSVIYTTGMPSAIARAALVAVDIIEHEPQRRQRLAENAKLMRAGLQSMGFNTGESQTPIIPVLIGDSNAAVMFSRRLFDAGIFVSAIRPPTVPLNSARLRVTVMATHTADDIGLAFQQFQRIGKDLCLI